MSLFLIMRLLFNSFKILSKSFASDGAPELIKMQTGIIDASSSTTVTLNPIKWPFVVENPHFKPNLSRCSLVINCLSLLKSQAHGVASTI